MNAPTFATYRQALAILSLMLLTGSPAAQQTLSASDTDQSAAGTDSPQAAGNQTQVYKVEREDGSVLFTDTPSANSQPVTLNANTANVTNALPGPTNPASPAARPEQSVNYKVAIRQPAPEATIRDNRGKLTVVAYASPANVGRLQVLIDGKVMGTSRTGQFSLTGIHRGAHQLQVRLVDNKGKTLASSAEQTFFMHQASALINPSAGQ